MVIDKWTVKRVLIAARTYPTPAAKGIEVSCTAGITDDGKWIRLFPVPYRFLSRDRKFRKYQWIDVRVMKANNDPRPESFRTDIDSITILSEPLPTDSKWQARKEIVYPLKAHCLCCLKTECDRSGSPTLGLFKPRSINKLVIEPDSPDWTPDELRKLQRITLFQNAPPRELEKLPYRFRYRFQCDEPDCPTHTFLCTDWEMGGAFLRFRQRYGSAWEAKFRQRFEDEMINKNDTHFYVGTLHQHPGTWIIVGLFYPMR